MLENIHDVAPGASLAFATGEGGRSGFRRQHRGPCHRRALEHHRRRPRLSRRADVPGRPDRAGGRYGHRGTGVTYFSAAGNQANDGYLSNFRAASGTVTGIGTGTFMNFNPNGGDQPRAADHHRRCQTPNIIFDYDQPFATQQPAGIDRRPSPRTSISTSSTPPPATVVVGAAGNNNNVAMQEPLQDVTIPDAGSYYVAIQVVSGANPGHVEFLNFNENVDLVVSPQYGSAGGTYYPTSFGHHTAAATIGVGATPWSAPSPYLGQNPLANEPFSSDGPAIYVFNANGTPISTGPTEVLNPTITAPDGGNTSFFSPGQIIDTSQPSVPGRAGHGHQPAQDLPTFFGTSSATPNAAAVAALMLQEVPTLTPAEIRQGLIGGATPMNGTPAGSWNQRLGLRPRQRDQRHQRGRSLARRDDQPGQRLDRHRLSQRHHGDLQQAGQFLHGLCRRSDLHAVSRGLTVILSARRSPSTIRPTPPSSSSRSASPGRRARPRPTGPTPSRSRARPANRSNRKTARTWLLQRADHIHAGRHHLADDHEHELSGRTVSITFSKATRPRDGDGLANIFVLRQGSGRAWPPTAATLSSYINLNSDSGVTTISYNPADLHGHAQLQRTCPRPRCPPTSTRSWSSAPRRAPARASPTWSAIRSSALHRRLPDRRRRDDAARLHPEPGPASPWPHRSSRPS